MSSSKRYAAALNSASGSFASFGDLRPYIASSMALRAFSDQRCMISGAVPLMSSAMTGRSIRLIEIAASPFVAVFVVLAMRQSFRRVGPLPTIARRSTALIGGPSCAGTVPLT